MPKKRPDPCTPIEAVGKELESLRNKRGWSQGDFAKKLDLSRSGYNLYERGVRGMPLDTCLRAAVLLGTTAGHIISDAESDYQGAFPRSPAELTRPKVAVHRPAPVGKGQPARDGPSPGRE